MIQPKGEQSGVKTHLGSRGTPRFFVETFLIPWCEKSVESKLYNEKISAFYVAALKEEIKRMESRKGAKNSGEITEAKCVSKGCSFQGLNPKNKSAVGLCAKCGNFEHFACVKIKAEYKEDIIKGIMKYYCSQCFSKNPSIGSSDTSKQRPRLNSLPVMGQGYLFKVTKSTTATAITTGNDAAQQIQTNAGKEMLSITKESNTLWNCETCLFETDDQEKLGLHIESNHWLPCDQCKYPNTG